MTHRTYTITLWLAGLLAAACAAATVWAATISVPATVTAAGPLVVTAGAAVIAYLARREYRATHVADLDEANRRENGFTR